jgi:kynurenine formamidase
LSDRTTATKRWTRRPDGSNWGDFGPDDQLGRMNLITPEMRLAALKEVKEGKTFVLSLPLDFPGGDEAEAIRKPPRLFSSQLAGNDLCNLHVTPGDVCCDDGVVLYLQHSTQWDSLAHWGRMFDIDGSGTEVPVYYNGFRASEAAVCADHGGPAVLKLGIENMAATGVQGRGVLVDLVRAFGTGRTHVGYDKLMQAMDEQDVEVRKGDFLLVHTGYGDAVLAGNRHPDMELLGQTGAVLDGNDEALLDWIERSGIVAVCADNDAVEEVDPNLEAKGPNGLLPLHDRCLFKLGIHLGELWWLGDLARYLESVKRHAFLLTAPPLRLPGAAGSPATPVATV